MILLSYHSSVQFSSVESERSFENLYSYEHMIAPKICDAWPLLLCAFQMSTIFVLCKKANGFPCEKLTNERFVLATTASTMLRYFAYFLLLRLGKQMLGEHFLSV